MSYVPPAFARIASEPGVVLITGARGMGMRDAGFRLLEAAAEVGCPVACNQTIFADSLPTDLRRPLLFDHQKAFIGFMVGAAETHEGPDPASAVYIGHLDAEADPTRLLRSASELRRRWPNGDPFSGLVAAAIGARALLVLSTHLADSPIDGGGSVARSASWRIHATSRTGGTVRKARGKAREVVWGETRYPLDRRGFSLFVDA